MTKVTRIAMIAVLIAMVAFLAVPAIAGTPNQDGSCIVPPDEYFVTDSPDNNGVPAHADGLQLGFIFEIPNTAGYPYHAGGYLGITEFKLKQSKEEQVKIAMGKYYYCDSLNQHPYKQTVGVRHVDRTGVSEDPLKSTYEPAHGSAIFR